MAEWYYRACNPSPSLRRNPAHDIARLATPKLAAGSAVHVCPNCDAPLDTAFLGDDNLDGQPWASVAGSKEATCEP